MKKNGTAVAETTLTTVTAEQLPQFLVFDTGPDGLRELMEEALEDGLSSADLERIKVPGAGGLQWDLPDASGTAGAPHFDGVIVAVQTTRAYWEGEFAGGNEPPACSSQDGITGRGAPGGPCAVCPLNQWGSGRNDMGTACGERKLIYILRPEDTLPVVLSLPVTSQKALRQYRARLLRKGKAPHMVVTRFGLERTKNPKGIAYSQVTLTEVAALPLPLLGAAKGYAKTIKTALGFEAEAGTPLSPVDTEGIPESDPPGGGRFAQDANDDDLPF